MTVNVEPTSINVHGNGTKTGYTFPFSWSNLSDIKVFFTPFGEIERQLGSNDFKLTPKPGTGGILEFLTVTPKTDDIIRVSRETVINQNIDYEMKQKVDYMDVQFSFDKITRILKELSDLLGDIPDPLLPDPTLHRIGQIIITDGADGYTFYPYTLTIPTDADDQKILMIDKATKTIKLITASGAINPPIPQPVSEYRPLISDGGAYILGPEQVKFLSTDVGYAEIWDGSKFIKTEAKGINNIPIVAPIKEKTVLTSKSDGSGGFTTGWVDDSFKSIETSSGVVTPCAIVKASDTTINITAGTIQIAQDTTGIPEVEVIQFAGINGFAIATNVGQSHLIYLDFTTSTPTIVSQVSYERLPRGRKVFIGEVEHTFNNIITNIVNTPTIPTSLASQLRQLFVDMIGNLARGVNLTGVNPNTLVLSAGTFIGWGANFATDGLRPHSANLPAKNPALFRWRDALGRDSAEANSINADNLQTDDGSGVLTPVAVNRWVQVLVWIYPSGSLVLQYPRISYATQGTIPSLSVFLDTVRKDSAANRNAAPVAVLNLQAGGTFADHEIFLLTGFFGAGSSTAGDIFPTSPGPSGAGKIPIVSSSGIWIVSPFSIPTPTVGDENLALTVEGSNYVLRIPKDTISRTWLSNGILSGFSYSFSGQAITIGAGSALFCMNGLPGQQTNISVLNYTGTTYTVPSIATQEVSYVYMDNTGALTVSATEDKLVRGNKLLLFRVEHGGNTVIEGMQALYYALNAIPEQVKEIFEVYGNSIKNFRLSSSGTNVITHGGGVYYGYGVGANTNPLTPNRGVVAAQNPLTFKFVQTDGTQSANQTSFPAIPKVELTANTLTDLANGSVAYYPIWIFPSGRAIIQYATQVWVAGSEPETATIWLTFQRDATLQNAAFLAGFVKWEAGKTFANGNTIVNLGIAQSGSGGGAPVIPATPQDEDRLYIVGVGGIGELGPVLQRPKADLSDSHDFANRSLEWNSSARALVPRDNIIPPFTSVPGNHLLSMQDGAVVPLTNRSDYVDISFWSAINIQYYITRPAPIPLTKKGFLVSKMTLNNEGGGLATSSSLRLSDVFTEIVSANFNGNLNAFNGTPDTNGIFDPVANWSQFFPTQGSNAAFLPAPNTMKYYGGTGTFTTGSRTKSAGGYTFIYSTHLYAGANKFYPQYSLSNTSLQDINLNVVTDKYSSFGLLQQNANVGSPGEVDYEGFRAGAILDFTGKSNIQITIEFVDLKFSAYDNSAPDQDFGLKLWTSSSTAITDATYRHITSYGTPDSSRVYTLPINLKTTANSSDTTVYHQNASDIGTQSDQYFYYGFEIMPGNGFKPSAIQSITATIKLNMIGVVNVGDQVRYEYGTLASMNTLPAEAGKVWDGHMPNLEAGKIIIAYFLLFPKTPASSADFDENTEGIILHPFIPNNVPAIFLENQTGTTKYTERIEAKRKKTRDTLFQLYELDCTATQFANWKLAIYFRSKLGDTAFKQMTDKFGASIWLVNENNVPL